MGKEDRDWYRDWQRNRDRADYRYDPKQFRTKPQGVKSSWLRLAVNLLALYGAISLVRQFLLPLL